MKLGVCEKTFVAFALNLVRNESGAVDTIREAACPHGTAALKSGGHGRRGPRGRRAGLARRRGAAGAPRAARDAAGRRSGGSGVAGEREVARKQVSRQYTV